MGALRALAGWPAVVAASIDRSVIYVVDSRARFLIWVIVLGFFVVVLSVILNIGSVAFSGRLLNGFNALAAIPALQDQPVVASKEVGFLWAVNWSLFCTVIAPIIVGFGLNTLRTFETTLESICAAGMLRDDAFRRVSYNSLAEIWHAHAQKNRLLFIFVLIAVIGFIMWDWWSVVGHPLINPDSVRNPLTDPQMEYDWSVSALFEGSSVNTSALLVFSFAAYFLFAALVPALVIAVTLCTIYFMVFVTSVRLPGDGKSDEVHFAAVPSGEDDRHFGFKVFGPLFDSYLLMSLFIMLGLWLMAVQNVYLRDPFSTNIVNFIWGDLDQYARLIDNSGGVFDFISWFVAPTRYTVPNIQVALSVLLMPTICLVSVAGSWFILRSKAISAGKLSRKNVAKLARELQQSSDRLDERLKKDMEVWPVGWITSRKLLAMMAFLFAALVSYRLIIIPLAFGGFISLWSLLAVLIERRSKD